VTINLRRLNQVTFNNDKTQVTVQGGTIISELVDAAYGNGVQVVTGNCNCIGVMGALLGGGYGRLMGEYGFMIDNVLSINVVTASGLAQTVTASSNPDLWFALRGAGANFAIVTSAVMKAYPTPQAENGAWLGALIYSPDSIEALVSAINDLPLSPQMAIFMYYATTGPPNYTPAVIAFPFYLGNATAGRTAFGPVFKVGPLADSTAWTPYNEVNAGSGPFCVPGNRKPSYGAAAAKLNPATWRTIWDEFNDFLTTNGVDKVGNSTVLVEAYSLGAAEAKGDASSAYAWRSVNRFNMVATAWYKDASFDPVAEAFGSKVRDLWRSTGSLPQHPTYVDTWCSSFGPVILTLK
jgi:FAD binding domain